MVESGEGGGFGTFGSDLDGVLGLTECSDDRHPDDGGHHGPADSLSRRAKGRCHRIQLRTTLRIEGNMGAS